jgi:serine palmitoyltransferase
VIPSFSKPGDFLVCDKGVSFAIQNGILLSRSTVKWFEHNDMDDLHRVLKSLTDVFREKKHRVFLLVESIYTNHGDLLDLEQVLKYKKMYPFRIILEESFTIGVLGKTGRGLTEHIGVPSTKVEIITASIGNALGSVGGFAVGTVAIANHMRLNCSGYVFSCSSPPFISKSCTAALEQLTTGPELPQLNQNISILHQALSKGLKDLTTTSSQFSPIAVLRLARPGPDKQRDERIIGEIIDELFQRRIVVGKVRYSKRETFILKQGQPHFVVSVMAQHTRQEIENLVQELNYVSSEIINK